MVDDPCNTTPTKGSKINAATGGNRMTPAIPTAVNTSTRNNERTTPKPADRWPQAYFPITPPASVATTAKAARLAGTFFSIIKNATNTKNPSWTAMSTNTIAANHLNPDRSVIPQPAVVLGCLAWIDSAPLKRSLLKTNHSTAETNSARIP